MDSDEEKWPFERWHPYAMGSKDAITAYLKAKGAKVAKSPKKLQDKQRALILFMALMKCLKENIDRYLDATTECLKDLIPLGETMTIDGFKVTHHARAGKLDKIAYDYALEHDQKIAKIEERYLAAKAERDTVRAEFSEVGTSIRLSIPK